MSTPLPQSPTPTSTPLADYYVTATAGQGGTITGDTGFAYAGKDCFFTITANPGYRIIDLKDNGISKGALSNYEITNINKIHTIEAYFTLNPSPTPTYTPTPSTFVSPTDNDYNLMLYAIVVFALVITTVICTVLIRKSVHPKNE
jgi:hypothetical protein